MFLQIHHKLKRLNHTIVACLLVEEGSQNIGNTSHKDDNGANNSRLPVAPASNEHNNANNERISSKGDLLVDSLNGTEALEARELDQHNNCQQVY